MWIYIYFNFQPNFINIQNIVALKMVCVNGILFFSIAI